MAGGGAMPRDCSRLSRDALAASWWLGQQATEGLQFRALRVCLRELACRQLVQADAGGTQRQHLVVGGQA